MSSASSSRTAGPKRRRSSSFSIACRMFSASSSSTSTSSLRVTRKVWCSSTSMPGNRVSKCTAMTSSTGTKDVGPLPRSAVWVLGALGRPPASTAMNRGSSGGTLTRAKCSFPVVGLITTTGKEHFARVKVPPLLPRFIAVYARGRPSAPSTQAADRGKGPTSFVPLEDVIAVHLDTLFPGMEVLEHHTFRVTRNEDVEVEEDDAENILQAMEKELLRRRFGPAVRLELAEDIAPRIRELLVRELGVEPSEVYELPAPLDLTGLTLIADLDRRGERVVRVVQQDVPARDGGEDVGLRCALDLGEVPVRAPDEPRVGEVCAVQVRDQGQAGQVERGGQLVDLRRLDAELADQQLPDPGGDVLGELQADRRPEPSAQQLLLHRLQDVLGVVLLNLHVLVAGDPEGVVLEHLHAREQGVQVHGDDVLDGHEGCRALAPVRGLGARRARAAARARRAPRPRTGARARHPSCPSRTSSPCTWTPCSRAWRCSSTTPSGSPATRTWRLRRTTPRTSCRRWRRSCCADGSGRRSAWSSPRTSPPGSGSCWSASSASSRRRSTSCPPRST